MKKGIHGLGPIFVAAAFFAGTRADAADISAPDPAASRVAAAASRLGEVAPAVDQVRIARPRRSWLARGEAPLLPPEAVAAGRDGDDLSILLLLTWAYAEDPPQREHYVSGPARAASAILGGYADDAAQDRDRRDPAPHFPRPARALGDYPHATPAATRQPAARRALAMAASAGISECRSVSLLRRLARMDDPLVRDGARRALKDLGTLAYAPAGDCAPGLSQE